jgi:hypothetical protein
LLPDRAPFGLLAFATFFALAGFVVFATFLLDFAFFGAAISVVVPCVLMVVLLCVECIGRHIHHSGSKRMRGERDEKEMCEERTR